MSAAARGERQARHFIALAGIFVAAMTAGLNNRVGAIALADIRGSLGQGLDAASWLSTVYTAGELMAMPFASWFAITLGLRRFHVGMVALCALLALALPFVGNLQLLLVLRGLQGLAGGALIPVLMMAALKFLPPPIRLHGLALYAMTATFAPNMAIWMAGLWSDSLGDLRWVYWQAIPLFALAAGLVSWGLPKAPSQAERFALANWPGMALGLVGLGALAVGLDQGVRLDWLASPLIRSALLLGGVLTAAYLVSEWRHPDPFIKLRLLGRRNLGLGFSVFVLLLIVMLSGGSVPSAYLAKVWGYRAPQSAPIGLMIALPQLLLGPCVAALLYRRWIDARKVFATGLALIGLSCLMGAQLTAQWHGPSFMLVQAMQALGQPMAVVSLLFLATSVVQPPEGPYVSGTINALRVFGTLVGGAAIGQLSVVRERIHADQLLDHGGLLQDGWSSLATPGRLVAALHEQAFVLATADVYRALGVLALLLIPLVLCLQYIPAPVPAPSSQPSHG
ncbi:MFS transporter [Bordetella trematum]|uniref:MFS family transporter n=1 Tax=Bordetella trematum TaxID=123899 RepID=A0A157SIA0_9BORD|nr:MFS transporter [Bordetella trematum]AZR92984.1 MFS transporter [Bordetella trematum]NNH19808.1 MFS transporter [Bordetella trematum]SAI34259.1 MFS family transporter [Bordetella trematum]SAI69913.1 MFS family transporter [Bordetella trematum]SUV99057.1 MFS family transporter [Bordetella trematum]